MSLFEIIRGHLSQPEYMHVLLNPMPIYGLAMGVLATAIALIMRSRRVAIAGLVLLFVGGFSAWPTYHYGQAAYDGVKAMSDPVGGQWLDEHMARAEKLIYAFYLLAAVALAGILAPLKWPRAAMPLTITALVLATGVLGIGGWIGYAGGHVRHPEFRVGPPPPARSDGHAHSHGGAEGEMDHGAMQGKPVEPTKPMDHSAMPGMEAGQSDGVQGQPMQHSAPQQPAAPDQLEASRLQLEASRLQLEASRKQLEAANGVSPGAAPPPPPTPSPKAEDGHEHEH
jgi:hypothetical protein